MNITQRAEVRILNLRRVIKEAEETITAIETAANKTAEVLAVASEMGVEVVGIGRPHELLNNQKFPGSTRGSIFTPHAARDSNGWPAAWKIAERTGIGYGCGNTGQHQIHSEQVIDGVYRCENGVWTLIDEGVDA